MKTFIKSLIDSLEGLLELAVDRTGIVKYATTTNAFMWGSKGKVERMVMYSRCGKQVMRARPSHFNIKDPGYWKGRSERFKELMKLVKSTNHSLSELYETRPEKGTFYNLLISQMGVFWTGGPAPALYAFTPGEIEVNIGNGTMPDAREVVFTPEAGGKLQIAWDTACNFPNEHDDDILQVMLIIKTGEFGVWLPMIKTSPGPYVKRSDGICVWEVPKVFLNPAVSIEAYCAVKFKAGALLDGKAKGIFKFPAGMMAITLMA
jgi:hypothetical protein